MSISEAIVSAFFETRGYQVSQPCKYLVGGRTKRPEEAADFLIHHPGISTHVMPKNVLWEPNDLQTVKAATVCVYGWHTDRIYPATISKLPEIVRFATAEAVAAAQRYLRVKSLATVLCLPQAPASAKLKNALLTQLRENGIDGVLWFRSILLELTTRVDANKNYHRSDVLQMLRIMKKYDLLRSPQMELFARRRSARRS